MAARAHNLYLLSYALTMRAAVLGIGGGDAATCRITTFFRSRGSHDVLLLLKTGAELGGFTAVQQFRQKNSPSPSQLSR